MSDRETVAEEPEVRKRGNRPEPGSICRVFGQYRQRGWAEKKKKRKTGPIVEKASKEYWYVSRLQYVTYLVGPPFSKRS